MPVYRIFFIDAADIVSGRAEETFENDATALAEIRHQFGGQKIEIWRGARLVGAIDGRPAASVFPRQRVGAAE